MQKPGCGANDLFKVTNEPGYGACFKIRSRGIAVILLLIVFIILFFSGIKQPLIVAILTKQMRAV